MKRLRPAALVGAGRLSTSFLSRLPGLIDYLGPIKAQTYRLASRLANNLRAGYSVKTYEELDDSRIILIAVPDPDLRKTVDDLARAKVHWRGKVAVVCGTSSDSNQLGALMSAGAATASLDEIDGFEGSKYVAEGHNRALREIRRLIERNGAKMLQLRPRQKAVYAAGVSFATSLITPLIEASFECLSRAGLTPARASSVIGTLVERSVRGYAKAGKKAWSGPLAHGYSVEAMRQADALARIDPLLSEYFEQNCRFALRLLKPKTARAAV
jgi:predicted short-subunit dehydrogenase-like oxidoreductase (DUF2520 family)